MDISNSFRSSKILVVGDIMLDTYYYGDVRRISPEAPVPVFRKKSERSVLGGAANVAANLVAAGQEVSVMSAAGNDDAGNRLRAILDEKGINSDLLFTVSRQTTEKIRFLASNNQQVMRLDVEDGSDIEIADENYRAFEDKVGSYDVIIISDYLKGLLTEEFTQKVIKAATTKGISVLIDVKDRNYQKYAGATLIKPNLKELSDLTGMPVDTDEHIIEASQQLRLKCSAKYVLTTCGGRGMILVSDSDPYIVDAYRSEVFDVTGAGDTAIAYLGACMANGMSMKDCVDVANCAAGIQVTKIGTSSVAWNEIYECMSSQNSRYLQKIISGKDIDSFRTKHIGQRIVFTNGCFDILHVGHVKYLQEAANLGDILVVGLNSDSSVKRLKGPDRPINNENDRAEMLCSLGCVDYVVMFDEDTPLNLINTIKPDVLSKGGDYTIDGVVGSEEVIKNGGQVVLIPFVEGKSTTGIIEKIKEKNNGSD